MRFLSPILLVSVSGTPAGGVVQGNFWFNTAENTLSFRDSAAVQHVPSKSLLASTTAGQGASLIGVEAASLTNISGSEVQAVLESIDQKFGQIGAVVNFEEQVINILDTPPGSPSTGDRYIVGTTPTGAFVGQAKNIAVYNGSGWDFTTISASEEGTMVYVQALDNFYVYNQAGNWVLFGSLAAHNGLTGLQGGTSNEYYHLTQADYEYVLRLDDTTNTAGYGASIVALATGTMTGLLVGADANVQQALVRVDSLGLTTNGNGASRIAIEDAAGRITATTVEGALAELPKIRRSTAITFVAGTPQDFAHNLGNRQVSVTLQVSDSGNAGEFVLAQVVPTPSSETSSIRITTAESLDAFVTVIG